MLNQSLQNRLLQNYPMLATLQPRQIQELAQHASAVSLPAGTVVFDDSQLCQGFPLLLSGSLRVIKAAASGRELLLYRVCAGETCILTCSCLLGNSVYHARGIVEQNVELVIIQPQAFKRLIDSCDLFRDYIFSLFSERITELMQLVSAVAFQKLDQRLAALLTTKSNPIHQTHQALADELGCVREIVSRLLKNFADQGWIVLGREQIKVLQPEPLRKLGAS